MVKRDKWINPEQINELLSLLQRLSKEQGFNFAVVGGIAFQYLGSDRLTKDLDVVADVAFDPGGRFTLLGPINFGGTAYQTASGGKLDYIVRSDEFKKLYEKALQESVITSEGFPTVTPDYLAAMKFVAHITDRKNSINHLSDLKWLLRQEGFVDLKKVEAIIFRFAGGRLPQEMFRKISDEVRFEKFEGK